MASEFVRLSQWVRPAHYRLFLFDLLESEPWTFAGHVQIQLALQRQSSSITLHSRCLQIHSAEVSVASEDVTEQIRAVDITYDEKYQRCTLSFGKMLPATDKPILLLTIYFRGTIGDDLVGFYRSTYECGREHTRRHMYSTQFQPCEARRAFPCFDEPDLKATFDFSIETAVPATALSNMPVHEVRPSETHKDRKVTTFQRTPVMSVYLLAWAVGHFDYLESKISRPSGSMLPIRLYTTQNLTTHARFALDLAQKIVPYFEEKFKIEYPLPKLDLIAIHDMADSMENWGLLTFEMGALLFDSETSSPFDLFNIAYTVAHEIAHQWYGNLVTMSWWDGLWLNEAFATWAGLFATDHFFPHWDVWAKFVHENMSEAFELDALKSSHPIHVPVTDDLEVDSIFDSISYDKGAALIRMIEDTLGLETFLEGVSCYLRKHSYQNTEAQDLWVALNEASGKDIIPFVTPWVEEMGFPLLTAAADNVLQQPFSYTPDVDVNRRCWWIPLSIIGDKKKLVLKSRETHLQYGEVLHNLPNWNYVGFFRTNFSPADVRKLSDDIPRLSVAERVGLIRDVAALAFAEESKVDCATLLSLLQCLKDEDNYYVLHSVLSTHGFLRSMFSRSSKIAAGLDAFLIDQLSGTAERLRHLDMRPLTSDPIDYLPEQARSEVLLALGMAGESNVVHRLTAVFRRFVAGERAAIPIPLQPAVFQVAINCLGLEAFYALRIEFLRTDSVGGEEKILTAMSQGLRNQVFSRFTDFAFEKQSDLQNMLTAANGLAANCDMKIRERFWEYIRHNWAMLSTRLGGSIVIFERFIRGSLETLASHEAHASLLTFFSDKDTTGYRRGLSVAVEKCKLNARFIQRDADSLEAYFNMPRQSPIGQK